MGNWSFSEASNRKPFPSDRNDKDNGKTAKIIKLNTMYILIGDIYLLLFPSQYSFVRNPGLKSRFFRVINNLESIEKN